MSRREKLSDAMSRSLVSRLNCIFRCFLRSITADEQAAIDYDGLSGDVPGSLRRQKDDDVGNVFGLAHAAHGDEFRRLLEPGGPKRVLLGECLRRADVA